MKSNSEMENNQDYDLFEAPKEFDLKKEIVKSNLVWSNKYTRYLSITILVFLIFFAGTFYGQHTVVNQINSTFNNSKNALATIFGFSSSKQRKNSTITTSPSSSKNEGETTFTTSTQGTNGVIQSIKSNAGSNFLMVKIDQLDKKVKAGDSISIVDITALTSNIESTHPGLTINPQDLPNSSTSSSNARKK